MQPQAKEKHYSYIFREQKQAGSLFKSVSVIYCTIKKSDLVRQQIITRAGVSNSVTTESQNLTLFQAKGQFQSNTIADIFYWLQVPQRE